MIVIDEGGVLHWPLIEIKDKVFGPSQSKAEASILHVAISEELNVASKADTCQYVLSEGTTIRLR